MSDFLYLMQCPECARRGADRGKDNLAVYTDHKWCFSCGYYEGDKKEFYKEPTPELEKQDVNALPFDFDVGHLPVIAEAWLKQYGIRDSEIKSNYIGWSPSRELLIFPVYGEGGMLEMWQGRYFGHREGHPKYLTKGYKGDVYHVLGWNIIGDRDRYPLVLVEDMVSAIKVARQLPTLPLWGSEVSKKQAQILSRYFKKAILWLDPDKKKASLKFQARMELFFEKVSIIYSDRDPKYYDDREIQEFLRVAMS